MAAARNSLVSNTSKRGLVGDGSQQKMASTSRDISNAVILTKDGISSASLAGGRNPR